MTEKTERAARQQALENQIRRLGQRIDRLQALSRRYAWYRLGIFICGALATWAAATLWRAPGGGLTFCGALIIFSTAVFYHQRLEAWIEKFKLWREIRADQLARLTLNWEALPAPSLPAQRSRSPLENDLDLTGPRSLHQLLDITFSRNGSQLLAEWLAPASPDLAQIHARQAIVRELVRLSRFRDRLRLTFRLVAQEQLEGDKFSQWLKEEFPARRLQWALPVSISLVAVNLALFLLNSLGWLPAYWGISLSLYIAFYYFNANTLSRFLAVIVALGDELGKFSALLHYLEKYPYAGCPHLAQLCAPFRSPQHAPSAQLRKIQIITAAVGLRHNPVLGILLNLILPWDFVCAWLAAQRRNEVAETLPRWLEICYQLEALVALADFACLNPEYTFPEITPAAQPIFQAEALGHPLLPPAAKICNTFSVQARGELAIITGSNMAGKSTFLKAVGVNVCLAYAGGPVNAARFRLVPLRLFTCIRIADSVTDGFSYFYAEVKRLKRLLEELQAADDRPLLYLIDEIFRGTNNRERLMGSRAYVKALMGANGIGLLSTHDLELASLADHDPQASNFHFRDEVRAGKLAFDYKIRPGPCPSTNALKIMQLEGLPIEGMNYEL